jgi:hypothetical protein
LAISQKGFVGPEPPYGDFELNRYSPQTRKLQGCWPFIPSRGAGGSGLSVGTLKDLSGYRLRGNVNKGSFSFDPVMGMCLQYANNGRYAGIDSSHVWPHTDSFSFSMWYSVDGAQSWDALFSCGWSSKFVYLLMGSSGQYDFRVVSDSGGISDTVRGTGYDDGIAHHVILSINRATDELYIYTDGKQVGAVTDISAVNGSIFNTQHLRFGVFGTTQYYWGGRIADPRVYRRALTLTDAEIMYDPATRWDLYKPIIPQLWPVGAAAATPPDAPTSLTATATASDTIALAWTDNASDETGFEIERSLDGSSWAQIDTAAADAESYNDTSCDPNTLYYYRVRAVNAAGNSDYTNTASATTPPDDVTLQQYIIWDGSQLRQTDYRYIALVDGVPTPDTVAGVAWIYVDEDDGDLKITYGDGTTKTIVADT